jgi:hypothetical protein
LVGVLVEGPESDAAAAFVEVVRLFDRLGLEWADAVGSLPELGAVALWSALGTADPGGEVGQVGRLGGDVCELVTVEGAFVLAGDHRVEHLALLGGGGQ